MVQSIPLCFPSMYSLWISSPGQEFHLVPHEASGVVPGPGLMLRQCAHVCVCVCVFELD